MRKFSIFLCTTLLFLCFALSANATLIGVNAVTSSAGDMAAIIAAPPDIGDDAATNTAQQGFNELQGVTLVANLPVDGGVITPQTVNSQMIFLNSEGDTTLNHIGVDWTFDGIILGVMSDTGGTLEAGSNSILGALGTTYPGAFSLRGFESNDSYSGIGTNVLTVNMNVIEPGDWIRVVTAPIPEPGTILLLGSGILGIAVAGRRKFFKKK
jgi:hypothetical protein